MIANRIISSLKYRAKKFAVNTRQNFKRLYQRIRTLGPPKNLILILGCQRSGTTLLERIFRHDLSSVVFGEFSDLSISPDKSVWQPLVDVKRIVTSQNARYVIARPLFESDRAQEILAALDNAFAVWLYRDYRQVVRSMLNKWKDLFFDISRQNESDENGNWRLESLYQKINNDLPSDASIEDKYALYWHARNDSFFQQGLQDEHRVKLMSYDQLVSSPREKLDEIMRFSGQVGVWRGFKTDAHKESLTAEQFPSFSPDVQEKCDQLMKRLGDAESSAIQSVE